MQENEAWISKKELIIPIISIIVFLLLVGSASYAYYTQSVGSATGAANISNANLTVPRGCTFIANATNCVILGNTATTTSFTDAYISRAEMSQTYAGNSIAQSTCNLNIGVQGNQGCRCTAFVDLVGQVATNYVPDSLKAQITSSNTAHNQALQSINTINSHVSILKVATTGTAVYENISMVLKAYNINSNQDGQAGINYSYTMSAKPICSIGDSVHTVTFNPNGGSVSTTSKSVTYGDSYGTLPTPTWSGHTFRGWNGRNKFNEADFSTYSEYSYYYNGYYYKSIPLKANTTYTFTLQRSHGFDGRNNGYLLLCDIPKINDGAKWSAVAHHSNPNYAVANRRYTTTSDGLLYLGFSSGSQAKLDTIWDGSLLQIEEGTEATFPEPYFITADTIVTQNSNHTLTAIWD